MAVNSILQRFGLRHVRPLPASTSVRPGSVSALLLGGVQPAQGISSLLGNRLGPSVVPQTVLSLPTSLHAVPMRGMKHEDLSGLNSQVCAILGGQWGDEGKGKLVDILASKYDLIARFNGGANAGHTIVVGKKKYAFHLLPCGLLYPGKVNIIGNGVVVHVPTMFQELSDLSKAGIDHKGRLLLSDRAHMLFDFHKVIDGLHEKSLKGQMIGTTKKGIGPCYSSKTRRHGVRVGDFKDWKGFEEKYRTILSDLQGLYGFEYDANAELEQLKAVHEQTMPMIVDTVHYVNEALDSGKTLLAEGANAAMLDMDFGTYPYVTSSSTTAGGICTGLGIAPSRIDTSIGIVKAYTTRVGSGPFPTELKDDIGDSLQKVGHEVGTTTGRGRRCGWLDVPVVRYSHLLNNYTSLNVTKLDVLSHLDEIKIGTHYSIGGKRLPTGAMPATLDELAAVEVEYESMPGWKSDITRCSTFQELPLNAQRYLNRISELVGVTVSWVGVGAARLDMATNGFDFDREALSL